MSLRERLFYKKLITLSYSRFKFSRRLLSQYETKSGSLEEKTEIIPIERIRNFSIVAHVDHGKSTLADRLLEFTGAIKPGGNAQVLDKLQVEKERGITVKAVTASLNYVYKNQNYLLNLIDTPGHVDFSNEVVRSVQACQGAILLVDAAEGPRAQTIAVHLLSKQQNLNIIPVLNKIDLPRANAVIVKNQLFSLFNIEPDSILEVSAKKGWGIENLVNSIIERIPPPNVKREGFLRALIFDTWYDKYRGILCLAYIENGTLKIGDSIKWLSSKKVHPIKYLLLLTPQEKNITHAAAGQVVVVGCGPRGGGEVGDIILSSDAPIDETKKIQPIVNRHMVYAGIFPATQADYAVIQKAIEKLSMNDPAVSLSDDASAALGQGWRIGFSGLLHMEVFTQRLLQEHKAEAVISAPSVPYKIRVNNNKLIKKHGTDILTITNPNDLPDHLVITEYFEPFVIGTLLTPIKYLGAVTSICLNHRGVPIKSTPMDDDHIALQFHLPLSEIIIDFHDIIKSTTSGYANFDYVDDGFHSTNLTRLNILLNGVVMSELTNLVHVSRVEYFGRRLVEKLKDTIPRQMIHIAIQATANGKVIARENLQAYRKDVTAKLYGGDVTRKMKLLRQQAEGKKAMKSKAQMHIPRDTLVEVLKKR